LTSRFKRLAVDGAENPEDLQIDREVKDETGCENAAPQ
jgi:hypothetical protein